MADGTFNGWLGCGLALWRSRLIDRNCQTPDWQIDVEPTRVYHFEDARQFLAAEGVDRDAIARQAVGMLIRAFVRARKPIPLCCDPI